MPTGRRGTGEPTSQRGACHRCPVVNPEPFEAVLEAHGAVVLGLLRRLVGPDAAQDCWQETFVAALAAYPRLRPDSNVRGWLLTIAHRKAVDVLRSRSRAPVPVGDELPEQWPAGAAAGSAADPAAVVPGRLDGRALWRLVGSLPDKQRRAVAYRFGADASYRELAELLACSEAAARRSVFEGLRTLRARTRPPQAPPEGTEDDTHASAALGPTSSIRPSTAPPEAAFTPFPPAEPEPEPAAHVTRRPPC